MAAVEKRGIAKGRAETARNAFAMGLTLAQIAQLTGLTQDELQKLRETR